MIVTGDGHTVSELVGGDYLGEISLIDGGPRTATVTALEPISALVVQRAGFERLMLDYPSVRLDVLNALTRRVREHAPAVSN